MVSWMMHRLLSRLPRLTRRANTGGPRRERGAVAVEYALAVSLVVVASLGSIDSLEDSTRDEYQNSADGIEGLPGNDGYGGGGAPASTTPPPTTSTTTVDSGPTTTVPVTTTTVDEEGPSTTTTSTVASQSTVSSMSDVSVATVGGKWTAKVAIEVRDSVSEGPIQGAAVTVSMSAANGSTTTRSCTTGPDGVCTASWTHRRAKHDPVLAVLDDVTASPAWDGQITAVQLTKP